MASERPVRAAGMQPAHAIVDATIASGTFTFEDRRKLATALADASEDDYQEVMSRLAVAINRGRVKIDPKPRRNP
jgi:hypothetical protein